MSKLLIILILSLVLVTGCSGDVFFGSENTNAITGNAVAEVENGAIVVPEQPQGPALTEPRLSFG